MPRAVDSARRPPPAGDTPRRARAGATRAPGRADAAPGAARAEAARALRPDHG